MGPSEITEFGLEAMLHRGRVDIGLERRAGLAERSGRPVELAAAIVPATDHGPNRAAGFQHHHGAFLDPVLLAELAKVELDRFLRGALQVHVDRGAGDHRVDAGFRGDPLGFLESPVEKIIGALQVAAVDDVGRVQARRKHLAIGHEAALHQRRQHDVGAAAGSRQVDVRGILGRRLEQAREHRRLCQVQILDVLAEIEIGCRRDAERAAAHIGPIQVELENLLLGQVHLEPDRQEGFLDLAFDRALIVQEQVLGQLLCDARAALHDRIRPDVLRHGADQPEEVDAPMLEEAAVFGGQHRLDDMIGHLVDRNRIAPDDAALSDLVAVPVEKGDREVVLPEPVARRLLEGGQGESQHDHRAGRPHSEGLAQKFVEAAPPAADAETAEEDRQPFPELTKAEAPFI